MFACDTPGFGASEEEHVTKSNSTPEANLPLTRHDLEPVDNHLEDDCFDLQAIVHKNEAVLDIKTMNASTEKDEQKAPKQPSGQNRIKFLNGLRGIAALLVCHTHAGYLKGTAVAPASVDTFFVLSSFLLTMLYEAKFRKMHQRKASAREWRTVLADYFVKRILRVYPLFATVVFVLTIMPEDTRTRYYNLAHYHIKHWSVYDILTFKSRYYLFWTMPIEITYYFVIPVFVAVMCLLGKFKWVAIAALYVWLIYAGAHSDRTNHSFFRPHLSTFMAGSLAGFVYADLDRWMKKRSLEPRAWQLCVVRVFEWVMVLSLISDTFHGMLVRWFRRSLFPAQNSSVPCISLPVSAVIVIEILAPSAISRALEWNVLCYTGKISFSMYLLHPFVNFQPWLQALPLYDQFFTRLVLFYLLATASYLVVEKPSQRIAAAIGKRLAADSGPVMSNSVQFSRLLPVAEPPAY